MKKDLIKNAELYEEEIINVHKKMKDTLCKAQQNFNLELDICNKNEEYEIQLDELNRELKNKDSLIIKMKASFIEEGNFLQEELKMAEETAIQAKVKYAQFAMDVDFYKLKYNKLKKELKKKNISLNFQI